MSKTISVIVHKISEDGLPDMRAVYEGGPRPDFVGRIAFIWDGCVVDGWPLDRAGYPGEWESSEWSCIGRLSGVTHWLEFPEPFTYIQHDGYPPGDPNRERLRREGFEDG